MAYTFQGQIQPSVVVFVFFNNILLEYNHVDSLTFVGGCFHAKRQCLGVEGKSLWPAKLKIFTL